MLPYRPCCQRCGPVPFMRVVALVVGGCGLVVVLVAGVVLTVCDAVHSHTGMSGAASTSARAAGRYR
jgi:hypothetical protein